MNKINEIPPIPDEIKDASSKGRLVLFIGAGTSRIVGCPSWDGFANVYLKYVHEKGLINYFEYEQLGKLGAKKIISICRKIIYRNKLPLPDIKKSLQPDQELLKKYRIYEAIFDFGAIFVTTNYDELLDNVALQNRKNISSSENDSEANTIVDTEIMNKIIYEYDDLLISKLENDMIIHIHGSVNKPDEIVASIVDYMKHYERNEKPDVLLKEIFEKHTVLFIGYGLEELEIIEYLIQKQTNISEDIIRHYLLQPFYQYDQKLFEFQKEYYIEMGVELIPYSIDKNGYAQLSFIMEEWSKQLDSFSKPKGYYDKIAQLDEVL